MQRDNLSKYNADSRCLDSFEVEILLSYSCKLGYSMLEEHFAIFMSDFVPEFASVLSKFEVSMVLSAFLLEKTYGLDS
jgi:hypothetical protein